MNEKHLLITTSTFPRFPGDTDPPFIYELGVRLLRRYAVTILAPHAKGLKTNEKLNGLNVHRFRYCFQFAETLAYEGGILNRIRRRPYTCFLIFPFLFAQIMALLRHLKTAHYSAINAHWILPQGLCAALALKMSRLNIPLVCTVHGGDIFALRDPFSKTAKRFVLHASSAIIAVSHAVKTSVLELGIPNDKVHVIPMGVDVQTLFVPRLEKRVPKNLLFVGRLVPKKGVMFLIEAMPIVIARHPDVCLTIIGSGPDEHVIKKRIAELRLENYIHMEGPVPHDMLPVYYQSASIVIFPSIVDSSGDTEGFGLVMVEAMGCGCAVIASDLPAIHDVIDNNTTGILVPPQNKRALADNIIYLLDNPDKRKLLGTSARKLVLERFDWTITATQYMHILDVVTLKS
ncbi:MAG: glycosyltransferase [Desulfobacterota bacterium]|nr:glycosyltransferase [Thermodesulfobacteriota bacterium]